MSSCLSHLSYRPPTGPAFGESFGLCEPPRSGPPRSAVLGLLVLRNEEAAADARRAAAGQGHLVVEMASSAPVEATPAGRVRIAAAGPPPDRPTGGWPPVFPPADLPCCLILCRTRRPAEACGTRRHAAGGPLGRLRSSRCGNGPPPAGSQTCLPPAGHQTGPQAGGQDGSAACGAERGGPGQAG